MCRIIWSIGGFLWTFVHIGNASLPRLPAVQPVRARCWAFCRPSSRGLTGSGEVIVADAPRDSRSLPVCARVVFASLS